MSKVFKVNYRCGNCGKEWSVEYEVGTIVKSLSDGPYVVGPMKWVECPCCQTGRAFSHPQIHIVSREPIGMTVEIKCQACGAVRTQELEREG